MSKSTIPRKLSISCYCGLKTSNPFTDTEEASETEITQNDEPYEIKEQMYQDKLASLKKRLQQLKDGTHHEYNRKVRKLEYLYKERIRLNLAYRDYLMECVDRDYVKEKKAAVKEFEEKKIDLRENLLSDYEDKRRTIEAERYSLELTGDSMEVKPVMTRKLRRRPNDPIPVPEKRRKAPSAQVTYLLEEKEIEADLKALQQRGVSKPLTPIRKPGTIASCCFLVGICWVFFQLNNYQLPQHLNHRPSNSRQYPTIYLWLRRRWRMVSFCMREGGSTGVNLCKWKEGTCQNFQPVSRQLERKL